MKIDAEMVTYLTGHFESNEVYDALIKECTYQMTAQKKKKYQYKYSTRRKTFPSIIQPRSIGKNLTKIKTQIEKGTKLGLNKRKKTGHQKEAIIQ